MSNDSKRQYREMEEASTDEDEDLETIPKRVCNETENALPINEYASISNQPSFGDSSTQVDDFILPTYNPNVSEMMPTLYNQTSDSSVLSNNYEPLYQTQNYPVPPIPQWNPDILSVILRSYPRTIYVPNIQLQPPMPNYWNVYAGANPAQTVVQRFVVQDTGGVYLQEYYRIVYNGAEFPEYYL